MTPAGSTESTVPPIEAARRYYSDSYARTFASRVIEVTAIGNRPAAVLEETFFYPTSGGQPFDGGTLGDRRVIDVLIRETDHAVVHVLDGPLAVGPVEGRIEWPRRIDHMQQHTGQHVLSQAMIRVADAATIGFHLGTAYVSIDLDAADLDERRRDEAFAMANEVVSRDVAVKAWFPTAEELAAISLRKAPEVEGALRVVAIGDFDVSACGGTHVARTGEVGLIHCLKTERLTRGTRVHFLAGGRARRDYSEKQAIVSRVSAALSCAVADLPAAFDRIQTELVALRRELARHEEDALDREAGRLAEAASGPSGRQIVRQFLPGRSVDAIKGLALRLTAVAGRIALLATTGERTQFVFARSDDVTADLKRALDQALAAIGGGKGGGTRVVQGGGAAAAPETVERALDLARTAIET